MIKIKSLQKFFSRGKANEIRAVNNISLELQERGMVAVFGRSGCGKTTLLNLIGGLDRFDSGSITIDGADISENTDDIRNRYIGYIFQNYNLLPNETCFENVATAIRLLGVSDNAEIEKRVSTALRSVGMEKFSERLPVTLSGGQQQRIAIARALVKNPRIILADEPTGNLDEANTLMIMDLIKAISRECLVILVTHEAGLVDHYCDTVIELSDGQVADIKQNSDAEGVKTRNKNHVYLSDYKKSEISTDAALIEYYGEMPSEPLRLSIVNEDGKFYLRVDSASIRIIDESSEIQLLEKVPEQTAEDVDKTADMSIDMQMSDSIEVKTTGRLFGFISSLKCGYRELFGGKRPSKRFLRLCLTLFAAVVVFMSATFGTAFIDAANASERYSKNTFYVYSKDAEVLKKISEGANNPDTGIDFIRLMRTYPLGDMKISFSAGSFETFDTDVYDIFATDPYAAPFSANAVFLDSGISARLPLLCGEERELGENEILISSALADKLIENSPLGYVNSYDDMIGFILKAEINGTRPAVIGVVESSESAVYLNPMSLARYVNTDMPYYVYPASDFGMTVGEAELLCVVGHLDASVAVGDTVMVAGGAFRVASVTRPAEGEAGSLAELAYNPVTYLVSDEDYIKLSKTDGETDSLVCMSRGDYYYTEEGTIPKSQLLYTVIHSKSPSLTAEWIEESFSELEVEADILLPIATPEDIFAQMWSDSRSDVLSGALTIIIFLALLAVCMYFIMRSSMIERIREIGIYRAIGVSKKNIIFKFFVQTLLLATLTVLIGYIASGAFIYACLGISSLCSSLFYYPFWLAAAVFLVLCGITVVSGILPVFILLLKTPSEILSKYDI